MAKKKKKLVLLTISRKKMTRKIFLLIATEGNVNR